MTDYPNDDDGDALRLIATRSDMSKPMVIDFQVAVPSQAAAEELGNIAARLGYHIEIYRFQEIDDQWTCQCSTRMLLTYEGVVAIQRELAELSRPFEGRPDGWGTFGNGSGADDEEK